MTPIKIAQGGGRRGAQIQLLPLNSPNTFFNDCGTVYSCLFLCSFSFVMRFFILLFFHFCNVVILIIGPE